MTTIDVLMPAAGDTYADIAAACLTPYMPAFAARGMKLAPRPWDTGPGDGKATLALFAWGYHVASDRWLAMLADWPTERPLFNPPKLMAWNTRKTYLHEFATAGIPIVPSRFCRADANSVAAALAAFDCDQVVVKPAISGGSYRTDRLRPGDAVTPLDDAIVQPFLSAVADEGELSFVFIGGRFSHAVRKVAAAGDFRVQPQFGGMFSRFAPDPTDLALAERALAAAAYAPLYARVDLIRLPDGALALMEFEAIEPDLYVEQEPEVPARLADALLDML